MHIIHITSTFILTIYKQISRCNTLGRHTTCKLCTFMGKPVLCMPLRPLTLHPSASLFSFSPIWVTSKTCLTYISDGVVDSIGDIEQFSNTFYLRLCRNYSMSPDWVSLTEPEVKVLFAVVAELESILL